MPIFHDPILLADKDNSDKCLTVDRRSGFYYYDRIGVGRGIYWVDICQRLSAKADSLPFQEQEKTSKRRTTLGWLTHLTRVLGIDPGQPTSDRPGYVHHSWGLLLVTLPPLAC